MRQKVHPGIFCGILMLVGGAALFVLDRHRQTSLLGWLGWPLLWLVGSVLVLASMLHRILNPARMPAATRPSRVEPPVETTETKRAA